MRRNEIEKRELRAACVHEASHALIVRLLGGWGRARIWRNDSQSADEKAWCGQFGMFASPMSPVHWPRLVGLAGLVGEFMANEDEREAWAIEESIREALDAGEVSGTDAALMGEDWTEADVEELVAMLSTHWQELQLEARSLEESAKE
jgi:hypothetical protein